MAQRVSQGENADIDGKSLVRGVFKIMAQRVSQGEIEDVIHMIPPALRELCTETVPS
jgi:uncharacterized protein (DUF2267 family)